MPRFLLAQDGRAPVEFQLGSEPIRIGRNPSNEWQIPHPSVSGTHCEVTMSAGAVRVRDLQSTNGTFVNGQRIEEASLQEGQTLTLGSVSLVLAADDANSESKPAFAEAPADLSASCVLHPGTKATLECPKCQRRFCKVCPRQMRGPGGMTVFFCPQCGGRCRPFGTAIPAPKLEQSFGAMAMQAFGYPFRKNGLFLLLGGTLFFSLIDGAMYLAGAAGLLGLVAIILLVLFGTGYLWSYMQRVLTSSAQGEDEMPAWPDLSDVTEDIIQPFFQWLSVMILCFAPALLLIFFAPDTMQVLVIPAAIAGLFYAPMALLAVACLDSVGAMNPALVGTSIMRVPGQYLLACLIIGALFLAVGVIQELSGELPGISLPLAVLNKFLGLFSTFVMCRILGVLYYANRTRLRWF